MRIAFLTGCLEPGKDGVGDYTRHLAAECQRQGNVTCSLALNDSFVEASQPPADSTLRLPSNQPWATRLKSAQSFLEGFNPAFISLQFVCYAYHPKGMVHDFGQWIEQLVNGRPLQIMFHELWIGAECGARLKERTVGYIQRHFILGMLRRLQPGIIHTSNSVYRHLLARAKIQSELLPLFGQIPVQENPRTEWLFHALSAAGIPISESTRQDFWLFGFFGELNSLWPPEPLFPLLLDAALFYQKKIVILSAGKLRSGEAPWCAMAERYRENFTFCRLGELCPQQISEYLHFLDFGIATTPLVLLQKSGSVEAMQDHGLPVIVNRDDLPHPPPLPPSPLPEGVWKLNSDLCAQVPALLAKHPRSSTLPGITATFLRDAGNCLRP